MSLPSNNNSLEEREPREPRSSSKRKGYVVRTLAVVSFIGTLTVGIAKTTGNLDTISEHLRSIFNVSQATIGNDNTIVGVKPKGSIGNGNTIIDPGDASGNAIVNRGGTAIGAGACAGPTDVAIGAGAQAGKCAVPKSVEPVWTPDAHGTGKN